MGVDKIDPGVQTSEEQYRSIKSIDEQHRSIKSIDEQNRSIKSIDEQHRSIKSIDEQFWSIKSVDAHYQSIVDDRVIQVSLTETAIDFLPKICAILCSRVAIRTTSGVSISVQ